MKKTFKEMCDELEYFPIENSMEKTADEVRNEIKAYIKACGWDCLSSYDETDEWIENHPEIAEKEYEDELIASFEYLCKNDCDWYNRHNVDWYEFNIYCIGKYTENEVIGVFHF